MGSWLRHLALAALTLAAAPALAATTTFTVTAAPGTPPIANAVTQNEPSSIYFDATNSQAGTTVTQVVFRLPQGYLPSGGNAGAGWTVTLVQDPGSSTFYRVQFTSASCSQVGIPYGATVRFRLDVTPPAVTSMTADATDHLIDAQPSDPCGGTKGWSTAQLNSIAFQRKALLLAGAATPATADSPASIQIGWTVRNEMTVAVSNVVVQAPTVTTTPTGGTWSATGCSPSALSLAAHGGAGDTGTLSCGYVLTASPSGSTSFFFKSTANSGSTATAVGAAISQLTSGGATAAFGFDIVYAGQNDTVRATLTVTNNKSTTITVTPPTYAQLTAVTNLSRAAGTADPAPASTPGGGKAQFVYEFVVTGQPGASYSATGVAATTVGNTNPATTPAGTVATYAVTWSPKAVVGGASARPRPGSTGAFTITVQNPTLATIGEIDVINPQNSVWLGLADAGGSTLTAGTASSSGATTTLPYTGSLGAGATATLNVKFNAVPAVSSTTTFQFYVNVIPKNSTVGEKIGKSVADVVPISDLASVTLNSNGGGNTLYWANTSNAGATHDGVVVIRSAVGTPPGYPVDARDYGTNPDPSVVYFDKNLSAATSTALAGGAYDYRICNHDSNFVYSDCATGFWNGAGWIDSVVPPASGWAHNLGGSILTLPGLTPGGFVGGASNVPSVNILNAVDGSRALPAFALQRLPSGAMPAATFGSGKTMLVATDQSGYAVAIDLNSPSSVWSATYAGEAFTGGPSGILRAYSNSAFQAAYSTDVLFLPSTSGHVLCVNAWTGGLIWSYDVGSPIRGAIAVYRTSTSIWLFVATDGGGVVALDLASSSGAGAPPTPLAGWTVPAGSYSIGCWVEAGGKPLCVDRSGNVSLFDTTGAVVASGASGLSTPSAIWGGLGGSGAVVSNASSVVVLAQSGSAMSVAGTWSPGLTLAPASVVYSTQAIYVGASDRTVYKLGLSNAAPTGGTVTVSSQAPGSLLGPAVYDYSTDLIIFGANDGHLWAVKAF